MKNFIVSILSCYLLFCSVMALAQSQQGFNYQAVARDNSGAILENTAVILSFRIREGAREGTILYQEVHNLETNSLGLVNTVIGNGLAEIGDFAELDWGETSFYLEVQLNGASVDNALLQAVPYAKMATEMRLEDLNDMELSSLSDGQMLKWNGSAWEAMDERSYVAGTGISIFNDTILNVLPDQEIVLKGTGATSISGNYPNFTISSKDSVADDDADPANEIQTLSLSGNTLALDKSGSSVNLSNFTSPWVKGNNNRLYYNEGNVGIGDNNPSSTFTIGQGGKIKFSGTQGDMIFADDQATIRFASPDANNAPMMEMFPGGTNNSTRMVIAHSAGFRTWGLQYNDTADAFTWLGNGNPALHISLPDPQRIGLGTASPSAKLHAIYNSSTGNGHLKLTEDAFDYSRIVFNNTQGTSFWEIAARTDDNLANATVNFFHSETSNAFSINARGRVGINDASPSYPLEVLGNGERRTINVRNTLPAVTTSTSNYGVIVNLAQAANTGFPRLYNLFGFSTDADAYLSYGSYGRAANASNFNYGVYGVAPTTRGYAGYFSGNVFTTAAYLPSDAQLKSGIRPLQQGLQTLMALTPQRYEYDTDTYAEMNLPEGQQFGFMAQDIEAVLPSLVKASFHPFEEPINDTDAGQGFHFKALNYMGLIPIMVSAIQEQQQQLKAQETKIQALEARLAKLEALIKE